MGTRARVGEQGAGTAEERLTDGDRSAQALFCAVFPWKDDDLHSLHEPERVTYFARVAESRGSDSESIAIFVFDVSVSYATSDDRSASLGQHVKHVRAERNHLRASRLRDDDDEGDGDRD